VDGERTVLDGGGIAWVVACAWWLWGWKVSENTRTESLVGCSRARVVQPSQTSRLQPRTTVLRTFHRPTEHATTETPGHTTYAGNRSRERTTCAAVGPAGRPAGSSGTCWQQGPAGSSGTCWQQPLAGTSPDGRTDARTHAHGRTQAQWQLTMLFRVCSFGWAAAVCKTNGRAGSAGGAGSGCVADGRCCV
jgi:hypothetical protein